MVEQPAITEVPDLGGLPPAGTPHSDRASELAYALAEYKSRPDVIGILLVGSASRFYCDSFSDFDVEVFVRDETYKQLLPAERLVRHSESVELLFLPVSELERKAVSTADIDHWPYAGCQILHDPAGLLAHAVQAIAQMPADVQRERVRLHYFEYLFAAGRLDRVLDRGDELNARLTAAQTVMRAIDVLFLVRGEWPPVVHWASESLAVLGPPGADLKSMLATLLRRPDRRVAASVTHELQQVVAGILPIASLRTLAADVGSADFRHVRERYGRL